ncbi:MAG: hypothetical protein RIB98_11540 [Acidimicrobiales bacterium]
MANEPPSGAAGLDELFDIDVWHDAWLTGAGQTMVDAPIVSVGGGLGSLALVDLLRASGVPTSSITVVSPLERPFDTYAYLARNSQIPDHERLRSDAGSVIDNVWGFPSYAFREARHGKGLGSKLEPLWRVLTEPILSDYFTPQGGQVYASVERECARIGWNDMRLPGQVRAIRRRADGGYFVVVNPEGRLEDGPRIVLRASHVHVSVGYPGLRFLPDLQRYRETHHDPVHVVNAYENHDHIYADLRQRPGRVIVRGAGIVASRVLQRLLDDRELHGADTQVLHLFRNYVEGPQGDFLFRRPGHDGFAYQAFNYPKASWGGQLRTTLLEMDPTARQDYLKVIGGTNTAPRRDWQRQIERAKSTGAYQQLVGQVDEVRPSGTGLALDIALGTGGTQSLEADYVIDATGLLGDIRESRILADILDHTGASTNPGGRLDVTPCFELVGTASGPGRMFASGSITLGGPYAPVDSFLGLQYVALQIADELARIGSIPRFGTRASIRQWIRWMRGVAP